jgi:hypothetical protein
MPCYGRVELDAADKRSVLCFHIPIGLNGCHAQMDTCSFGVAIVLMLFRLRACAVSVVRPRLSIMDIIVVGFRLGRWFQ